PEPFPAHLVAIITLVLSHIFVSMYKGSVNVRRLALWTMISGYVALSGLFPTAWATHMESLITTAHNVIQSWNVLPKYAPLTIILPLATTVAAIYSRVRSPHAVEGPVLAPIPSNTPGITTGGDARPQPTQIADCVPTDNLQSDGGPGWNLPVAKPM